jgi:hypothetical protein
MKGLLEADPRTIVFLLPAIARLAPEILTEFLDPAFLQFWTEFLGRNLDMLETSEGDFVVDLTCSLACYLSDERSNCGFIMESLGKVAILLTSGDGRVRRNAAILLARSSSRSGFSVCAVLESQIPSIISDQFLVPLVFSSWVV